MLLIGFTYLLTYLLCLFIDVLGNWNVYFGSTTKHSLPYNMAACRPIWWWWPRYRI